MHRRLVSLCLGLSHLGSKIRHPIELKVRLLAEAIHTHDSDRSLDPRCLQAGLVRTVNV